MSSSSPQNSNSSSTVGGAANAPPSLQPPSVIPFNAPSAIPFSAPAPSAAPNSTTPHATAQSSGSYGQPPLETPVLPQPGSYGQRGAAPGYVQPGYGQQVPPPPYAPPPGSFPPPSVYGQQPYGQPAAGHYTQPVVNKYGQPGADQYSQPGMGPFGQQNGGLRPMASSTPVSENAARSSIIGVGLVGVLLAIVCGLGFGFMSVSAGFRIRYLSLASGLIIGFAIRFFGQIDETIQGGIAAGSTIVSFLIAFGIMYYNDLYKSPFYIIICGIAVYYAYRTASHE